MDIDSPPSFEESLPLSGGGNGQGHGIGHGHGIGYDPHQGHYHLVDLPPLSASFPLPFRVLTLVGLAIFLWGSNLQILHSLGINPAKALGFQTGPDLGLDPAEEGLDLDTLGGTDLDGIGGEEGVIKSSGVGVSVSVGREYESGTKGGSGHKIVYKIGLIYSAWVAGGWLLFRLVSGGEVERMESCRGVVGLVMIGAALGALVPYRGVGERERRALRRALSRILFPSLDSPIFFSDVILADILTSFAKVLGDLWVSTVQIWSGGITQGRVGQGGWSRWITLGMVCLPYALRFRQCIIEYHQSSYSQARPLANALKYFSAFPVILLSALQKTVVADLALVQGITVQELKATHSRWFGEHRLFRLWLLAVVVNSMFSFYWDVEMDWGLKLCEVDTWFPKATPAGQGGRDMATRDRDRGGVGGMIGVLGRCLKRGSPGLGGQHQRSPCPTPSPLLGSTIPSQHAHAHTHARPYSRHLSTSPTSTSTSRTPSTSFLKSWLSFGLRPILLLPDPIVYHIFTLIDLVLRATWSLKLSSHLHTIAEIESGVFMMEALELLRRWMWVFVRVEWEAVKQAEVRSFAQERGGPERGLGLGQVIWNGEDKDGV